MHPSGCPPRRFPIPGYATPAILALPAPPCFDSERSFYVEDTILEYRFEGAAMYYSESHSVFGQLRGYRLYWFKKGAAVTGGHVALDAVTGIGPVVTPLPGIEIYGLTRAAVLSESEFRFLRPDANAEFLAPLAHAPVRGRRHSASLVATGYELRGPGAASFSNGR